MIRSVPDTIIPEEAPTDPDMCPAGLLAGLLDPPPPSDWEAFASEDLDDELDVR